MPLRLAMLKQLPMLPDDEDLENMLVCFDLQHGIRTIRREIWTRKRAVDWLVDRVVRICTGRLHVLYSIDSMTLSSRAWQFKGVCDGSTLVLELA